MPRLHTVLKEINVGFDTAKDFLRETYGVSVQTVNEKITEEQFQSLVTHYKQDMVLHSVIKKTFATRPSKKNPKGIVAVYNKEEKEVLNEIGNILDVKHNKVLTKVKRKGKNKYKMVRKGGKGSNGKKIRPFLTDYVYPYVRIVSVPFGGQKRR